MSSKVLSSTSRSSERAAPGVHRIAGTVRTRVNRPSFVRPCSGSRRWNTPVVADDERDTNVISVPALTTTAGRSGFGSCRSRSGGRSQYTRRTSGSYGSSDARSPGGSLINSHRNAPHGAPRHRSVQDRDLPLPPPYGGPRPIVHRICVGAARSDNTRRREALTVSVDLWTWAAVATLESASPRVVRVRR